MRKATKTCKVVPGAACTARDTELEIIKTLRGPGQSAGAEGD